MTNWIATGLESLGRVIFVAYEYALHVFLGLMPLNHNTILKTVAEISIRN